MQVGIFLYAFALLAQVAAALFALNLFFRSKTYRLASGFLLLGLILMVGRRLFPLLDGLNGVPINLLEASLAVPISFFLLLGMFQFKKLLIDLEEKNFVLDQSSKTDSLTSALSRAEVLSRAELEIKKAFRSQKPVSFLMLDIDHFKRVNDTHGHPIGDQVLIFLVRQCLEHLREIDTFGRVGGEEFFVVLPETDQSEAVVVAERMRSAIEGAACHTASGVDIFITISIGVAVYEARANEEMEAAAIVKKYYAACDNAMYQAKKSGRNRIVCMNNSHSLTL